MFHVTRLLTNSHVSVECHLVFHSPSFHYQRGRDSDPHCVPHDIIRISKYILEDTLSDDEMRAHRHCQDVSRLAQALQREARNSRIHFSFAKNHRYSRAEVEYKLEDIVKLRHLPAHPNMGIDNRTLLQVITIAIDWLGFVGYYEKAEWWSDKMNMIIHRMAAGKPIVENTQNKTVWKRMDNEGDEDDVENEL